MFRKTVAFIVVLIFLSFRVSALDADDISAECAVLMTAQSGSVIFSKNDRKIHSMASTTKIMTSLLAVESGRLQNEIKVTDGMVNVEGTSMGLSAGDSVSLKELCYGMLLPSGNDAANSAAVYLGGNTEKFAQMMNRRAKEIGMTDTNFVTPSGLDDENHYSTAYDMALLGREAVRNPEFLKICSSQKARLTYGNPPYERTLYNHNRLLSSCDSVLGIKTGFTKKSGRCLVTYAEKDGVGLVAVTLNAPDDWNDHMKLLDYGFSSVSAEKIQPEIPASLAVVGGNSESVKISVGDYCVESTAENVTFSVYLPKFVYAPINVGNILGSVNIFIGGRLIDTVSVTACTDVSVKIAEIKNSNKGIFERLKEIFHD